MSGVEPPQNIPHSGAVKFVGRDEVLEKLRQELQQNQTIAIKAAIIGMGGVGKTELALQYAYKHYHLNSYPGGLCWLQAKQSNLGNQIVSFGKTYLNLNPPDNLDLWQQVQYCWRNWEKGKVLIILDDVEDYQAIKPYLPPAAESSFSLLLTTRQRLGSSIKSLDLEVLSPAAALELLKAIVGDERIERELEQAEALCKWLGYLPLALELVGRYLDRDKTLTLAKVQARLEKKRLAARALCKTEGDMTANSGVAAAFELTWSRLPEEARELGCWLSLFAPAPFEWKLAVRLRSPQVEACLKEWDEEDLEEVRNEYLVSWHLLQLTEKHQYVLHPLIREFFCTKLELMDWADESKSLFCQVMVAVAKEIPETPTRQEIETVSSAIPHLAEVATTLTNWIEDEDIILPFLGLSRFYQSQGAYEQAEPWCEQCLSKSQDRLGPQHPDVATSLCDLAALYFSQGKYQQAEPLYLQALEMYKQLLGPQHLAVSISLNNLALLYESQGKYQQAEPFFLQALEMRKQLLGPQHPDVAANLNNLALLYESQGKYQQAEPFFLQALEMNQQLLGQLHPDVATSLHNLAALYFSQGKYQQAEPFYLQALEIRKQLLGPQHPDVAANLNNLALLYQSQGKYQQAKSFYLQTLEMTKQLLGYQHPAVATSLNNLAALYKLQGKYQQAEPFFLQALEIRQRLLGQLHPDVASSLNNLALLYFSQGKYQQAEPLYLQALEIRKQLLGYQHPAVATSLNNLALLYKSQGKYQQAEPFFLQALEIRQQLLGEQHPDVAASLHNLAALYESQGKYQQAEPLYLQALEMTKQLLGPQHPAVATSLNNIAGLYKSQTKYSEAKPLFQQALDIVESLLGTNHPNTVVIRRNLEILDQEI